MRDFDTNKNGSLDKKELKVFVKAFYEKMMPGRAEPDDNQFEKIFKNFDTNGNGIVENDEIFKFIQAVFYSEGKPNAPVKRDSVCSEEGLGESFKYPQVVEQLDKQNTVKK